MNDSLLRDFQPEEVAIALQQMHLIKSPRPNDMPPIFYKKFWNILGPNVIDCVLNTLNFGTMPTGINETHICLIPKNTNP